MQIAERPNHEAGLSVSVFLEAGDVEAGVDRVFCFLSVRFPGVRAGRGPSVSLDCLSHSSEVDAITRHSLRSLRIDT